MRIKSAAFAVVGAIALGASGGYAAGAKGAPAPSPAQTKPSADSMMGGKAGSEMMKMMDAEHARMLRDPEMRELHQAMVKEHTKTMRDPAMQRLEKQAMKNLPEMAQMMRKHMGG